MFCNEFEETLFSPLPASLWSDYYRDEDDETFEKYGCTRSGSPRSILPSYVRFRSLPIIDEESDVMSNVGEVDFQSERSHNDNSVNTSDFQYFSCGSDNGMSVKSLFNHGCLFTYASPTHDDNNDSIGQSSLSPPRRHGSRQHPSSSPPNSVNSSSPSKQGSNSASFSNQFRRNRHRFR